MNCPIVFTIITRKEANFCLEDWGHRMGPLNRGNQAGICHALFADGKPVVVTTASTLIRETVALSGGKLHRGNTIELSRLCAARPGLCRVGLRLWREFVFPLLGYDFAISYQDADMHTGATYRFDGWRVLDGVARSGVDSRSGRQGRNKRVWVWPPEAVAAVSLLDGGIHA